MTWADILIALERLRGPSPVVQPGLCDRVMHRLLADETPPTTRQLRHEPPVPADAARRYATTIETITRD